MQRTANSRLLYLITWVTDFAAMLLIFTVSRNLAETGAGLLKMGAVGAGISLMHCVSSLVFGRLSDRIGRRGLIFGGQVLMLLSCVGCLALHADRWPYFIAYFTAGVGLGMIYPALIAWLNQGGQPGVGSAHVSRILVRFCLAWNLGMISGQMAGGWLFQFEHRWPIGLAVVLITINLALVLLTDRRSSKPQPASNPLAEPQLRERAISAGFAKMSWIANLGGALSVSMILHLFPKLAVSLNVPSDRHGTMLAVMRLAVIGTYLLMHYSRFWHYRFAIALAAQAAGLAGLACLALAQGMVGLISGLMGVALLVGYNYFAGLYYSTTSRGDEGKGFVSGMHEATLGLGIAAGSMGGGIVGSLAGERTPYVLAICVVVALAVVQIVIYSRQVYALHQAHRH